MFFASRLFTARGFIYIVVGLLPAESSSRSGRVLFVRNSKCRAILFYWCVKLDWSLSIAVSSFFCSLTEIAPLKYHRQPQALRVCYCLVSNCFILKIQILHRHWTTPCYLTGQQLSSLTSAILHCCCQRPFWAQASVY